MLRQCVMLAVLGCVLAVPLPQHQYQAQEQPEGIPPHLLRQYVGAQQAPEAAQTQIISRPTPARLPYAVQPEPQYQPQYQSQPQYKPQSQYQPLRQQQQQSPPEDYDPNPSYQFGFDVNDDQYTNYQNRKEQRDGDVIKGSYSVVDSDGFIRTVSYTADPKEGFKAEVSRQPTDIVVKIPTPKPQTQQQYSHPQPQAQQYSHPQPQAQQYSHPQQHPQQQQQPQPQHQSQPQYYRYPQ